MGFFSSILGAAVKTALTPIAIVKDAANVAMGEEANSTKKHLDSISDDVEETFDDIT